MRKMRAVLLLLVLGLGACGQMPATPEIGANTLNVADTALVSGDPALALRVAEAILQSDPENVPARLRAADALYALGQIENAKGDYENVLASQPGNTLAEIGLGRCLLFTDAAAAATAFRRALANDAGNVVALNDLGIAEDLLEQHKAAQEAYHSALSQQPDFLAATVNLALSLALSGQAEQAVAMLRPWAMSPDATLKLREDFAAALTLAGHEDEAKAVLRKLMTTADSQAALDGYAALRPVALLAPPAAAGAPMFFAAPVAAVETTKLASVTSAADPLPASAPLAASPAAPAASPVLRPALQPAAPLPVASPPAPAASSPAVEIVVRASGDTWISVMDRQGGILESRLLHAGETLSYPVLTPVVLTTGNAAATELVVKGQSSGPLGAEGVVEHFLLDPARLAADGPAGAKPVGS